MSDWRPAIRRNVPTAEMAARAHDVAALALKGRNACLNFVDSASILPLPDSMSIADIQRKAAEAANLFRPAKSSQQSQHCAYTDEETVFEMPMLLSDMAEGLLLPPPHDLYSSFSSDETGGDCEVLLDEEESDFASSAEGISMEN